ncbi:MAG: hypothetical protein H0V30_02555 [Chitinophagaceae bacterium]|jgi:hypothetical protein|nr:hypothetical protein [Chitinophagaceae bacterium]
MKKFLLICSLSIFSIYSAYSQDDRQNEQIREKMSEFIQKRMNLSKAEAEKFNPIFYRYFQDWRKTLNDNKNDRLVLQQKVAELRLRYRNEFKGIIGEKRSNEVYKQQEVFIRELRQLKQQRDRRGKNF